MDPVTIGLGLSAVGALGGLAGMFKKTPKYNAPTLSELKKQNPELYDQLMSIQRQARIFEQMADKRQGIPPLQSQMMSDQSSQIMEQMANRGLVGSSAGAQMQADARSRMMNQALEQAFRERMGLQNAALGANQAFLGGFNQATAPIGQANQINMQNQMAADAARNQFFSGLMGSGMNLYGTGQYMDALQTRKPTYYGGNMMVPSNQDYIPFLND